MSEPRYFKKSIAKLKTCTMPAFARGSSVGAETERAVRLSRNENCLGFSPKVLNAISNNVIFSYLYPEESSLTLRQALGAKFGLSPDCLVCGNGADNLLSCLTQAFVEPLAMKWFCLNRPSSFMTQL